MLIKVEKLVFPGRALARSDGKVIFVDGLLPGESAEVEIVREHARHAEARLVRLVEPSAERIDPVCPYAGRCPGCVYQHLLYTSEVDVKHEQFVNALEHKLKIETDSFVMPPMASPAPLGYRSRIRLHGEHTSDDGCRLGYRMADRSVIDIDCCALACVPINEELQAVRSNPALMRQCAGNELLLRWTKHDGVKVLLSSERSDGLPSFVQEETALGPLLSPVKGFFQVNPAVAGLLTGEFSSLLNQMDCGCAVDLYCGSGVFALLAADNGIQHVLGVDNDRNALRCAKMNAKGLELKQVEWYGARAADIAMEAIAPLRESNGLLIVDPPRRGLERDVLRAIVKNIPPHVVYVSCSVDTMVRDAVELIKAGYKVSYARMFDMFPRTPYFETMTWFTR